MKKNYEYLLRLRDVMKSHNIDVAIISGTDPHQSENPPLHWRGREWLTGFWSVNGTNGTAVVLADEAYCWTDNRFFLQAEEQLKDTGFKMMPEDGPNAVNLIDWVTGHLKAGQTVGIDGETFSITYTQKLEQKLTDNGIKLVTDFTPFDVIYEDRPNRPLTPLFVHDESIVGESVDSKIERAMQGVKSELADAILLSSLDDIAWLTNVRAAGDIAFSPVFISYLYIDAERRILFVDPGRIDNEVANHLKKYHFEIKDYADVFKFAASLPKETRLLIDPTKTSRTLYDNLVATLVFGGASVARLKGIKTPSMIKNFNTAMEKDGVALTRFFMFIEKEYPTGQLTEMRLVEKLRELRLSDPTCVDESFASIIGWNAHGAIVHYEPTEETDVAIKGDGLLLVDSGGQYTTGTTDITRTIALGTPTEQQRHDFTLVLQGHIDLTLAVFPEGTRGSQLDTLAHLPLWREGKTYYHGTGHGVGFFVNVHEGPHSIRFNDNPAPLEPGMVTSNEPGLYLADRYGIRSENVLAIEVVKNTEFGAFLGFKALTLFPYDSTLIDASMLTEAELTWLNNYHEEVYARLSPLLTAEEAAWLKEKTRPIRR